MQHSPESCASCGVWQCPLNVERLLASQRKTRTAVLVDEYWPEFDDFLAGLPKSDYVWFAPWRPLAGFFRNYAWRGAPQTVVRQQWAPDLVVRRSLALRWQSGAPGARARLSMTYAKRMAKRAARLLSADVTHVITAQSFLPELEASGALGGRKVTVLMQRYPLAWLQRELDAQYAMHPESKTLHDFRAELDVVAWEARALEEAVTWVTPHAGITSLAPEKTVLLPWRIPAFASQVGPSLKINSGQIVFLGPTIGRRGAYAVRDMMKRLDLPLTLVGDNLEHASFWNGVNVSYRTFAEPWWNNVRAVLAPVVFDHQPRKLLAQLPHVPRVFASEGLGLCWSEQVRPFEEAETFLRQNFR